MIEEKEYQFFHRMQGQYWNSGNNEDYAAIFDLLRTAWDYHAVSGIDLDSAQLQCEEIIRFMKLQKRFIRMHQMFGYDMGSYPDGFQLAGTKFETLDELEKAIKNKAFL